MCIRDRDKAAELYKVEKKRVIKWLRYNGRGKFVKQDIKETVEAVEVVEEKVAVAA